MKNIFCSVFLKIFKFIKNTLCTLILALFLAIKSDFFTFSFGNWETIKKRESQNIPTNKKKPTIPRQTGQKKTLVSELKMRMKTSTDTSIFLHLKFHPFQRYAQFENQLRLSFPFPFSKMFFFEISTLSWNFKYSKKYLKIGIFSWNFVCISSDANIFCPIWCEMVDIFIF